MNRKRLYAICLFFTTLLSHTAHADSLSAISQEQLITSPGAKGKLLENHVSIEPLVPGLLGFSFPTAHANNAFGYEGNSITMTSHHEVSLTNFTNNIEVYKITYKLRDHDGKQTARSFQLALYPHQTAHVSGSLSLSSLFLYPGIFNVYADTDVAGATYAHITGFGYVNVAKKT